MKKLEEYKFIGNKELLSLVKNDSRGYPIKSINDIKNWIVQSQQKLSVTAEVTATFVIDLAYCLLINDRHSEHVVCANGQNVLAAGEIIFELVGKQDVTISQITNQSTGYCPSPASWKAVEKALQIIGIKHPNYFTTVFEFRVCANCNWVNIIKNDYFVCENNKCENILPEN